MESRNPFRAVIVGSGLVGLTAAHVFSKASIDFVVLEKHESPLSPHGAVLALWPQTFRVFDQLGLLEAVQPFLHNVENVYVLSTDDGRIRFEDTSFKSIEKSHGYKVKVAHRPQLVKLLYDSLPDTAKSRILSKKHVVSISVNEGDVKAVCEDGSTHEGSVIIGADGVRSQVRLSMQALREGRRPEDLPQTQDSSYITTYRMYYASVPILPGLGKNTRYDGARDGVSTQLITGEDRAWFGLYEKLENPTSQRTRYTETDSRAILERWGHLYMAPGWTFHDVNASRVGYTSLIDLEEGLVDRWSSKRIVLVGDAIRKLEPHAGLGYNSGVTDIVVLVNGLRQLLRDDGSPSTQVLEQLFEKYQTQRTKDTQKMAEISMKLPRTLAWLTWKDKAMAKYAIPYLPLNKIAIKRVLGPSISGAPVLEWLDEKSLPVALKPWKYHPAQQGK